MPSDRPALTRDEPVILVGGGALGPGDLAEALSFTPHIAAADGGAAAVLAQGHVPEAVIGDFDSLDADTRAKLSPETLIEVAEQDSTDFDKALRHISAPLVLAVGFTGARVDHELAVYHTLAARPRRRCIVIGPHDIVFHLPPAIRLDLPRAMRVSLFPMAEVTGRSKGLRWPIEGLVFHPASRIGTSNQATGGEDVVLETDGPGLLAILPSAMLSQVVAALRAADGPGPAGGSRTPSDV